MLDNPNFWNFLTAVAMQVLAILLPVAIGYAVLLINSALKYLKARIGEQKYQEVYDFIRLLVLAAEQTGLKGDVLATGAEKKKWVLDRIQSYVDEKGYPINVADLSSMIEAAVMEEINRHKIGA